MAAFWSVLHRPSCDDNCRGRSEPLPGENMSDSNHQGLRVVGAEIGKTLPAYDFLGQERLAHDILSKLNLQRRVWSQLVAGCFSRLFNGSSCQVDYSPFQVRNLAEQAERADWLWVQAESSSGQQAWLAIEARQLFQLAILFFGGSLLEADSRATDRPLSETEQRLLLRLSQHQLDILSDLLEEPETVWELNLVGREALPNHGLWSCSESTLLLGEHDSQILFWWPVVPAETPALPSPDSSLQERMQAVLPSVPLRLRVVLSEFSVRLAELQQLQVGDVLPLELLELAPALIGNHSCLLGQVAENNGALVYRVAAVEQPQVREPR